MPTEEMAGLFKIRLIVDSMKHQIERCMIDHDGVIRATLDAQLKRVVEEFDFVKAIREEIEVSLERVVRQCIHSAVAGALSSVKMQSALHKLVKNELAAMFGKEGV